MNYDLAVQAQTDLEDIWAYIQLRDPSAADRWLGGIIRNFRVLAQKPEVGQAREALSPGLRFFPLGNYLIFYRPAKQGVKIVRVLHGSRDISASLFES